MHEVSLHSILNEVVMEKVVDRVLAHRERFSRSERSGRALSVMSSIETPPRSESGYFSRLHFCYIKLFIQYVNSVVKVDLTISSNESQNMIHVDWLR